MWVNGITLQLFPSAVLALISLAPWSDGYILQSQPRLWLVEWLADSWLAKLPAVVFDYHYSAVTGHTLSKFISQWQGQDN